MSHLSLRHFTDGENKKHLKEIWETLRRKGNAKGELPVKLRSGEEKLFEFTITSNLISGFYMSIMRDITEKRLMELKLFKSEERFREIFENAMDAIVIWSDDGKIAKANESACRIFELPMDKLVETNLCTFIVDPQKKYKQIKKNMKNMGKSVKKCCFRWQTANLKSWNSHQNEPYLKVSI